MSTVHIDTEIGMVQEPLEWTERTQCDGVTKYWHVRQEIGSLLGSAVDGHLEAFGRTKEQALERLKEERKRLNESLWAF